MFEKYKFIENFRLHAACYLMMDLDPPADEYTEVMAPHLINFLYLKDKPIPLAVDYFLKQFSKLWFEGNFPDIQKKFEDQKHENPNYIKRAKSVLSYQYEQQNADSFYIMNPNGFYPIELTRPELKGIADVMGLNPAFLQDPAAGSEAKVKKELVTENHVSRQHQKAKERCREIAKQILKENPKIDTISEAIFDDRMTEAATKADGDMYAEKVIHGWIKDLFPDKARKPGRRPKK